MSTTFKLQVPQYDAARFSWSGRSFGTAEASDLGLRAGMVPYGRAYPDACDEGIELVNEKRGTRAQFVLESYNAHRWTFCSINLPKRVTLTILND